MLNSLGNIFYFQFYVENFFDKKQDQILLIHAFW